MRGTGRISGRGKAELLCCASVVLLGATACGDPLRTAADVHGSAWSAGSPKAAADSTGTIAFGGRRDLQDLPLSGLTARIKAARGAAKSVRVKIDKDGSAFDLTMDYASGDTQLTMSEDGVDVAFRLVGSTEYVKGNAAFWRQAGARDHIPANAVALLADKWVSVPEPPDGDIKMDPMRKLADPLKDVRIDGTARRLPQDTVDGRPMLVLSVLGAGSNKRGKVYVPLTGSAFPARITTPDGRSVDFTPSAQQAVIAIPPGAVPLAG